MAIAVRSDSEWVALSRVARISGFVVAAERLSAVDEVERLLESWTSSRTRDEVFDALRSVVPVAPVRRTTEVLEDPHLLERNWFTSLDHPDMGHRLYAGVPWRLSGVALPRPATPPPRLGEHSREVLRDVLGFDDYEIGSLFAAGVTGEVLAR